jgi:flagellar hook-associated protein 3 FlgL
MRISFQSGYRNALADLARTSEDLARYQREVSSGRRVAVPSHDPTAAAGAVSERAEMGTLDQYLRAADSVSARLAVIDTVLGDVVSKLTQAQAVVAGAMGNTATVAQREAAARELAGIRDALLADFNTSFAGTFLFAGTSHATPPYVRDADGTVGPYQGNTVSLAVDVDRRTAVQVSFDGQVIARGSDALDIFATLQGLMGHVVTGDQAALQAGLDALKRGFDRAVQAQSYVGTDQAAMEDQRQRVSTLRRAAASRLSSHEDTNMAEAISGMSRADAAHRAALGAAATVSRVSLMDYLR